MIAYYFIKRIKYETLKGIKGVDGIVLYKYRGVMKVLWEEGESDSIGVADGVRSVFVEWWGGEERGRGGMANCSTVY